MFVRLLRSRPLGRGFTLLELVVAVVILAILAAFAVPSFARVIERSHDEAAAVELMALQREVWAVSAFGGPPAYTAEAYSEVADGDLGVAAAPGLSAADSTLYLTAGASTQYGYVSVGTSEDGSHVDQAMLSRSGNCVFLSADSGSVDEKRIVEDPAPGSCRVGDGAIGPELPVRTAPGNAVLTVSWDPVPGESAYLVKCANPSLDPAHPRAPTYGLASFTSSPSDSTPPSVQVSGLENFVTHTCTVTGNDTSASGSAPGTPAAPTCAGDGHGCGDHQHPDDPEIVPPDPGGCTGDNCDVWNPEPEDPSCPTCRTIRTIEEPPVSSELVPDVSVRVTDGLVDGLFSMASFTSGHVAYPHMPMIADRSNGALYEVVETAKSVGYGRLLLPAGTFKRPGQMLGGPWPGYTHADAGAFYYDTLYAVDEGAGHLLRIDANAKLAQVVRGATGFQNPAGIAGFGCFTSDAAPDRSRYCVYVSDDTGVHRVSLDDGTRTQVPGIPGGIRDLAPVAYQGKAALAATLRDGTVRLYAPASGAELLSVAGGTRPEGIAIVNSHLFWADPRTSTVRTVDLSVPGAAPRVLAGPGGPAGCTGLVQPRDVHFHGVLASPPSLGGHGGPDVYVTDSGTGSLMKLYLDPSFSCREAEVVWGTASGSLNSADTFRVTTVAGNGEFWTSDSGTGTTASFPSGYGMLMLNGRIYMNDDGHVIQYDPATRVWAPLGNGAYVGLGALATDGAHFYSMSVWDGPSNTRSCVSKVPLANDGPKSASPPSLWCAPAVDNESNVLGGVGYSSGHVYAYAQNSGTLYRVTPAGVASVFVTGLPAPASSGRIGVKNIVFDAESAFVSTASGLYRVSLATGEFSLFASGSFSTLATDGSEFPTHLFGFVNNELRRYRISDGSMMPVAGMRDVNGLEGSGYADGLGANALFKTGSTGYHGPRGVVSDGKVLYVADTFNKRLRVAEPGPSIERAMNTAATKTVPMSTGDVVTVAGNGSGTNNPVQGTGTSAGWYSGNQLTMMGGRVYSTGSSNRVVSFNPGTGAFSEVLTGPGGPLTNDGTFLYGVRGNCVQRISVQTRQRDSIWCATTDGTTNPSVGGIAVGPDGFLYVYHLQNGSVYRISLKNFAQSTLATGLPTGTVVYGGVAADDKSLWVSTPGGIYQVPVAAPNPVKVADLRPEGLASAGEYLYATTRTQVIRFDKALAYPNAPRVVAGSSSNGFADGAGVTARFYNLEGVVSDGTSLYVNDSSNYRLRRIDVTSDFPVVQAPSQSQDLSLTGTVSTLAGTGTAPPTSGAGPDGVAAESQWAGRGLVHMNGKMYGVDSTRVYEYDPATQRVTTPLTGLSLTSSHAVGDSSFLYAADGNNRCVVRIFLPKKSWDSMWCAPANYSVGGIAVADGKLFVFDQVAGRIYALDPVSGAQVTVADGLPVHASPSGNPYGGMVVDANSYHVATEKGLYSVSRTPGAPTVVLVPNVRFHSLTQAGSSLYGATYTTASGSATPSHKLYRIPKSATQVAPVLLAGNTSGYADGQGAAALFNTPRGLASDGTFLYVSDLGNYRLRRIG